jgi:hypothetical protein
MTDNQGYGAQLNALVSDEEAPPITAQELLGDQTYQAVKLWQQDQEQRSLQQAIQGSADNAARSQQNFAMPEHHTLREPHERPVTVPSPFGMPGSPNIERNTAGPVRAQPAETGTPITPPSAEQTAGGSVEATKGLEERQKKGEQLAAQAASAKQQFDKATKELEYFDRQAAAQMQAEETGAQPTQDLNAMRANIENRVRNAWALYASAEHEQAQHEYAAAHTGKPMPMPWTAALQGLVVGSVKKPQQTLEALRHQRPTPIEESPAAQPIELGWPSLSGISKGFYGLGESAPEMGGGIFGAMLGSEYGPLGTLAGTAGGAAFVNRLKSFGSFYEQRLNETPDNPDAAYVKAMADAQTSSLFTGAGWALFAAKPFQSEIRNALMQSFGVQPSVAVMERMTNNIRDNKPLSEGTQEAYTQGVFGVAPLMLGHVAINRITGHTPTQGTDGRGAARPTVEMAYPGAGLQTMEAGVTTPELKAPAEPQAIAPSANAQAREGDGGPTLPTTPEAQAVSAGNEKLKAGIEGWQKPADATEAAAPVEAPAAPAEVSTGTEWRDIAKAGEPGVKLPEAPATAPASPFDALYNKAVDLVRTDNRPSANYLQRKMGLGYIPASELMARMEKEGVVSSPHPTTGRRLVLPPKVQEPVAQPEQPQTAPAPIAAEAAPVAMPIYSGPASGFSNVDISRVGDRIVVKGTDTSGRPFTQSFNEQDWTGGNTGQAKWERLTSAQLKETPEQIMAKGAAQFQNSAKNYPPVKLAGIYRGLRQHIANVELTVNDPVERARQAGTGMIEHLEEQLASMKGWVGAYEAREAISPTLKRLPSAIPQSELPPAYRNPPRQAWLRPERAPEPYEHNYAFGPDDEPWRRTDAPYYSGIPDTADIRGGPKYRNIAENPNAEPGRPDLERVFGWNTVAENPKAEPGGPSLVRPHRWNTIAENPNAEPGSPEVKGKPGLSERIRDALVGAAKRLKEMATGKTEAHEDPVAEAIATSLHEDGQTPEQIKGKLDELEQHITAGAEEEKPQQQPGDGSGAAETHEAGSGSNAPTTPESSGERPTEDVEQHPSDAGAGEQAGPDGAGAGAGEPKPAAELTDAERNAFDAILASRAKQSEWGSKLGVSADDLKRYIEDAVRRGKLREADRNGIYRRTPKGKEKPAETQVPQTPADIADLMADNVLPAVPVDEAGWKALIPQLVDRYTKAAYSVEQGQSDAAYARTMMGEMYYFHRGATETGATEAANTLTVIGQRLYQAMEAAERREALDGPLDERPPEKPAEQPPAPAPQDETPPADLHERFVAHVKARLIAGERPFKNIIEARQLAKALGLEFPENTSANKQVDELVERAVVEAARVVVEHGRAEGAPSDEIYERMVKLYDNQPNLATRTGKSISEQAYSTPAPLAYVASRLAGIDANTRVLEPTAGNGMLLMEATPKHARVNEIDATRAKALEAQGFQVTKWDATEAQTFAGTTGKYDVVITNPPFGAVKVGGKSKVFKAPGLNTTNIDHAIALNALQSMKSDGRAVLIVGGVKADSPAERAAGYGSAKRKFWNQLLTKYKVADVFTVDGDLYAKQGAGWPVDVIVIHGKGRTEGFKPLTLEAPPLLKSWEEVGERLRGTEKQETPVGPGLHGDSGGKGPETPGGEPATDGPNALGGSSSGGGGAGERQPGGKDAGGVGGPRDIPEPESPGQPPLGEKPGESAGESGDVRGPDNGLHPNGGGPVEERPTEKPPERPADYGSKNTLITKERADAVRERLRQKLRESGSQLNAGIDPEFVQLGTELAVFHIEAGVRKFADFVAAMTQDLGAKVADLKPYLRSWYNGARDMIEDHGLDTEGLEHPDVVRTELDRLIAEEVAPKKNQAPPPREKLAINEGDTQTPYMPVSKVKDRLGTLLPANLHNATNEALDRIQREHGSIDHYVANGLGRDPMELGKWFAQEQVDAIALAMDNLERGGSLILGDQTGIGKGRVVAAMITYARKRGLVPVFVTEKADLYGDMWRDLHDIEWDKQLGRPIEMMMTNSEIKVPLDEAAVAWTLERDEAKAEGMPLPPRFGQFSPSQTLDMSRDNMMALRRGESSPDVVFTTYSQMQSTKGQENDRRAFLLDIAPAAFLIMDEAHNAGGGASANERGTPKGKAPPASELFREAVNRASAVMYSSATYAKSPNVMTLYSRTDMAKAVEKVDQLPGLIARGGVPLQQIVASMLAKAGQYLRRERSFEGVEYKQQTVPVKEEAYQEFTHGVSGIFRFDLGFAKERKEIAKKMAAAEFGGTANDNAIGEPSASSTSFSSLMHNVVNQMVVAMKVEQAGDAAIEALKRGEKPVLTLSRTNLSFIKQFREEQGYEMGHALPIGFADILHRYLERTRRVTLKSAAGEKVHKMIALEDMSPRARARYNEVAQLLREVELGDLPISPIDAIRNKITQAGYSVREITGRSEMLDYSAREETEDSLIGQGFVFEEPGKWRDLPNQPKNQNEWLIATESGSVMAHAATKEAAIAAYNKKYANTDPIVVNRPAGEQGAQGKAVTKQMFNDGSLDAIILNSSGSTGISLHSYSKFKDQRRRHMIIVEPDANIDTHMQTLGRVHRTGQVIPPIYTHLTADIPAEVRPTAVLMRKMASLNANTTGATKSHVSGEAVDFLNKYGDQVVLEALIEDREIADQLGVDPEGDFEGLAAKATGRLTLLSPKDQKTFLDDISQRYTRLIAALDATGANDLEAKYLNLQTRILESQELKPATGDSPFQEAVKLDKVSIKSQGRAMAPSEVVERIEKATKSKAGGDGFALDMAMLQNKGRDVQNKLAQDVDVKIDMQIQAIRKAMKDPEAAQRAVDKILVDKRKWRMLASIVYPGARVDLHLEGETVPAIAIGLEQTKNAKNPIALSTWTALFALPDSRRTLGVPLSKLEEGEVIVDVGGENSKDIHVTHGKTSFANLEGMFEAARKEGRETRYMLSGNILAGFSETQGAGQIVMHSLEDGTVQPGILMARQFKPKDFLENRAVRFASGRHVLDFFKESTAGEVVSSDKIVTIRREPQRWGPPNFEFEMPPARGVGGKYFGDQRVRDIYDNWQRSHGKMRATVDAAMAENLIDAMRDIGASFETRTEQNLANSSRPAEKPVASFGAGGPDIAAAGGRQMIDPHTGIDDVKELLAAGRTAVVHPEMTAAVHDVLTRMKNEIPAEMQAGALVAIDPIGKTRARLRFTSPDGGKFSVVVESRFAASYRALFDRTSNFVLGILHAHGADGSASESISETLAGRVRHEIVHFLRDTGRFSAGEWNRLVDHANKLHPLDWSAKAWLTALRDPLAEHARHDESHRDWYEDYYKHLSPEELQKKLDEEQVAHSAEFLSTLLDMDENDPFRQEYLPHFDDVMDIYGKLFSGELARRLPEDVADHNSEPGELPSPALAGGPAGAYTLSALNDKNSPEFSELRKALAGARRLLSLTETSGKRVGAAKDSYAYQLADTLSLIAEKGADALDAKMGPEFTALKELHRDELELLAPSGSADPLQDGFHAFMRSYIEESDALQKAVPEFFEAFEHHVEHEAPKLLENLQKIQEALGVGGTHHLLTSVLSDPHFSGTFGVDRAELFDRLGRAADAYKTANDGYENVKADVTAANDYLKGLPADQRSYVLFNTDRHVMQAHPVIRANKIANIIHQLANALNLGQLRDTSQGRTAPYIQLPPERAKEVYNLLLQHAGVELHNAMYAAGHPGYSGAGKVNPRVTLADLKEASPAVRAELDRRLKRANIQKPLVVDRFYPLLAKHIEHTWQSAAASDQLFRAQFRPSRWQRIWKAPAGFVQTPNQGFQPPQTPAGGAYGPAGVPKKPSHLAAKIAESFKRTMAPESISEDALKAGPRFKEFNSLTQQGKDAFVKLFDNYHKAWNRISDADQIRWLGNFERGTWDNMNPWEREFADLVKPLMDWAYDTERDYGSKAAYRENYLAHMWELGDRVTEHFNSVATQNRLGPTWFQKARVFDFVDEGLAAGYKLKTTNPAEIITKRLMASIDMQERMKLLADLRDTYGLAAKAKGAPPVLDKLGWREISAPDRENWLLHPDLLPTWDNVLAQTGWWGSQGWGGSIFRGWMGLKALWVPIKLAVSGFHPLHVVGINWAAHVSRGLHSFYGAATATKTVTRKVGGATVVESRVRDHDKAGKLLQMATTDLLRSLDPMGLRYAAKGGENSGWYARQAWEIPEKDQTPEQRAIVKRIAEMGLVPQMPEEMRVNSKRAFSNAMHDVREEWSKNWHSWDSMKAQGALGFAGAKRVVEHGGIAGAIVGGSIGGIPGALLGAAADIGIRRFIFERWIPAMKISAALLDDAAMAARHPEIYADDIQRKVAREAIGEQNENRFGEMFHKNLFWDKKLRETLTGVYLSMPWQLGFLREHLGAPISAVARVSDAARGLVTDHKPTETRATIRAAENKLLYVPVYLLGGAMAAAMIQYFRTGSLPDPYDPLSLDWQMPKVGGNNADGSPRRVSTMWYNREYVAWIKHMQEMGGGVSGAWQGTKEMNWNKLMLQPLWEMYTGQDYFRNEIRDPHGTLPEKIGQTARSILTEQLSPMSWTNAQQALKSSSSPASDVTLSLLGFGPAPAYVSRTATQNRIAYLYREYNQGARPYSEVEIAKSKRDAQSAYDAAKRIEDPAARRAAEQTAVEKMHAVGAKIRSKDFDVTMFSKLPPADQLAILEEATPAEANKYVSRVNKKLYGNPDFWALRKTITGAAKQPKPVGDASLALR